MHGGSDHNSNLGRKQAVTKDGKKRYLVILMKAYIVHIKRWKQETDRGGLKWVTRPVLCSKDHSWRGAITILFLKVTCMNKYRFFILYTFKKNIHHTE